MVRLGAAFGLGCLLVTPSLGLAECLTADDFKGLEQTAALKAGDEWRLTVDDEGFQQAEYRDPYGEPLRWQVGQFGVYPSFEEQHVSVDPAAGVDTPWPAADWVKRLRLDNPPTEPVAGGNWNSSGRAELEDKDGKKVYAVTVTYSFDPEKTVSLSGCPYRAIGVNGNFSAGKENWTGRWVYFPDLKIGVPTKATDPRTQEDWSNGMIALGQ